MTTAPVGPVASTGPTFAGTVNTGAVVSRTVTVKVFVVTFAAASVAVTVTVVDPIANDDPEATEYVIVGAAVTASVAVAAAQVAIAPAALVASTVTLPGTVSAGAVVSSTVTVNDPVAMLPWPSVAVTLTVVTPRAKVVLEAIEVVIVTGPTASVAVGENVALAPAELVASTVTFGAVITGAIVSMTVTVKVAVDVLPAASFAVTVTVVGVPNGSTVPADLEKVSEVTPTASVAVAANVPTSQPPSCVA